MHSHLHSPDGDNLSRPAGAGHDIAPNAVRMPTNREVCVFFVCWVKKSGVLIVFKGKVPIKQHGPIK